MYIKGDLILHTKSISRRGSNVKTLKTVKKQTFPKRSRFACEQTLYTFLSFKTACTLWIYSNVDSRQPATMQSCYI